jgi:quercetin dioxygenase-like cupin family protein
VNALILQNRHTGERLELRRVTHDGQTRLAIRGTLPPHQQGPPLHVHFAELEEGHVLAGTLHAVVDGRTLQIRAGGTARFPIGSAHRWWNGGDDLLIVEGFATPVIDLDRYLESAFEVLNHGAPNRPPLFYIAHIAWRHRRTQGILLMPRPIQNVLFPLIVLIGTILGVYRGNDWPGAPARSTGAPLVVSEDV